MAESWASSDHSRRTMRANRGRDTKPELLIRRALHARGWRFRVGYRPLPQDRRRTVDIAFTRKRVIVLIDGCFWHGCSEHFIPPVANADYWRAKIRRNQERDVETNALLRAEGWTVLRVWEHESVDGAVAIIEGSLQGAISEG
ncbi:very short patch repair endonuclease [Nesterenkonia cremea]|uniref:Very short patch repair endonuclease n=1 Tax=Nesterenkonia cremea TaxID=1882340 RepID=A0A917ARI4_9MICC|nr:very short patch repair endonuclease [Nesterenkonia cremea]GGE65011.1 hypothetical protein GCM10011401_10210 [Nesterenkonia cremea]